MPRVGEQANAAFHAILVRYQDLGSVTGPRLSTIFFAVSWEMLGRKTTRQLHVPPFPGTLALYAFGSSEFLEILS